MRNFVSATEIPLVKKIIFEPQKPVDVIALWFEETYMIPVFLDYLNNMEDLGISIFKTFDSYKSRKHRSNNNEVFLNYDILLNPSEWYHWEEASIDLSQNGNTTTFIIDINGFASDMAEEIWVINENGEIEKLENDFFN